MVHAIPRSSQLVDLHETHSQALSLSEESAVASQASANSYSASGSCWRSSQSSSPSASCANSTAPDLAFCFCFLCLPLPLFSHQASWHQLSSLSVAGKMMFSKADSCLWLQVFVLELALFSIATAFCSHVISAGFSPRSWILS